MADGPHVVDTSGWIEWLTKAANAARFAELLDSDAVVLVPTIAIYEVVRWLVARTDADSAQAAAMKMRGHIVVDLDPDLAVAAALLSKQHRLPMADSIILATARRHDAILWTQDAGFDGLDGVNYIAKITRP